MSRKRDAAKNSADKDISRINKDIQKALEEIKSDFEKLNKLKDREASKAAKLVGKPKREKPQQRQRDISAILDSLSSSGSPQSLDKINSLQSQRSDILEKNKNITRAFDEVKTSKDHFPKRRRLRTHPSQKTFARLENHLKELHRLNLDKVVALQNLENETNINLESQLPPSSSFREPKPSASSQIEIEQSSQRLPTSNKLDKDEDELDELDAVLRTFRQADEKDYNPDELSKEFFSEPPEIKDSDLENQRKQEEKQHQEIDKLLESFGISKSEPKESIAPNQTNNKPTSSTSKKPLDLSKPPILPPDYRQSPTKARDNRIVKKPSPTASSPIPVARSSTAKEQQPSQSNRNRPTQFGRKAPTDGRPILPGNREALTKQMPPQRPPRPLSPRGSIISLNGDKNQPTKESLKVDEKKNAPPPPPRRKL